MTQAKGTLDTPLDQLRGLPAVIGEQLRAVRGADRQEDTASIARDHGLNWTRSTVAAVEAGERGVSLEELLLLSMAFRRPLSWWVEGDGPHTDELVRLTPAAAAPRKGVVSLLRGRHPDGSDLKGNPGLRARLLRVFGLDPKTWPMKAGWRSRALQERLEEDWRRARELWPRVDHDQLLKIYRAATRDAEMKAARTLRLTPFEVATLSMKTWGHGLTEERDRRLGQVPPDTDPRSLQATRGHITRALLEELRQAKGEQ